MPSTYVGNVCMVWMDIVTFSPLYISEHSVTKAQKVDGLVQERCNSSALAMELHLFFLTLTHLRCCGPSGRRSSFKLEIISLYELKHKTMCCTLDMFCWFWDKVICLSSGTVLVWRWLRSSCGDFYPRPVLAFGYCLCLRLCVCVCLSVCPSVCQSLACPRDNSGPVQASIAKFGPKMQKTLVKVPIVLGGNWPWPSRSNLT